MVYLLKMVIFHGYVKKPDGNNSPERTQTIKSCVWYSSIQTPMNLPIAVDDGRFAPPANKR